MAKKRAMELESRVEALERALQRLMGSSQAPSAAKPDDERGAASIAYAQALAALRGEQYAEGDAVGALGFAGALQVGKRRYAWARETPVPQLLHANWMQLARWLAAMASEQRIALLLAHLGRDRSTAELSAVLGDVSPGQLYHHLKELQATGILLQVSRGVYRIAPVALIPVLVALSAAADVVGSQATSDLEPFATDPTSSPV